MLRANGSNPELLLLPASFGKGLCKEILLQFTPLLGHLDMDWGRSEQQPGTSNNSFPPPFPHAELPLSKVRFALGPFWKSLPNHAALCSCQITADSEVSYFQAGDVMPHACVRGTGSRLRQGAQQSRSANTRMLPLIRRHQQLRAAPLLWALPWCSAGRVTAEHSQSQELPAAAPNIHRVRKPKNALLAGNLLYAMHKNSVTAIIGLLWLTDFYRDHQLPALLLCM